MRVGGNWFALQGNGMGAVLVRGVAHGYGWCALWAEAGVQGGLRLGTSEASH